MPTDISALSIGEMLRHFAGRSLSPVDVFKASLERLARVDARFNAFCFVDEARGLAMARASETRWFKGEAVGALDGVPVAIKDTNHVAGWPTRSGSLLTSDEPVTYDAPGVARLREAGAVLFCKTTTPEFGWKGLTHSPLTGVTRNPWDGTKTPGGSSGGSAVAVATGVVPIATAGDGGGSTRIPAAFTGLFGMKPSFGMLPNFPNSIGTLGVYGALTRSVREAAMVMDVLGRPDGRDPFAIPHRGRSYGDDLDRGVAGLRIAYSRDLGFPIVHPEVAQAVERGVALLAKAGATVEEVTLDLSQARRVIDIIWQSGFDAQVARYASARLQELDPDLSAYLNSAGELTARDLQGALDQLRALAVEMQDFHQTYDLLVTPTMPIAAFEAGLNTPDAERYPQWFDWTPMTWPFNLTGQPAASVPCGLTVAGLPIGLQIVGPMFGDDQVLRASRCLEDAVAFPSWLESHGASLAGIDRQFA